MTSCLRFLAGVTLILLGLASSYGQTVARDSQSAPGGTNQAFYVFVGRAETWESRSWRAQSATSTTSSVSSNGTLRLSVAANLPLNYSMLYLGVCEVFRIADRVVTNVQMDKKVVLLKDEGPVTGADSDWRKRLERLPSSKGRLLFYAEEIKWPEGLLKDFGLSDSVVLKVKSDDRFGLSEEAQLAAFHAELIRLGIVMPELEDRRQGK